MTGKSNPEKAEKQFKNLEVNRETLQDLTELEAEAVQGGRLPAGRPGIAPETRKGAGTYCHSSRLD